MVRIKNLSNECKKRPVSRAIPAQVACRLLGNSKKPCILNLACKPSLRYGALFFYGIAVPFLTIALSFFCKVLQTTRLYRPLAYMIVFVLKPFKLIVYSLASVLKFYKELPG